MILQTFPSFQNKIKRDDFHSAADLWGVSVEKGVPEVDQSEGKVLEEEETQELAHSDVRPTPVHQQEALQVTELSKGVVAGHDGLHPLLTADTDTDVCSWRESGRGEILEQIRRILHTWREHS